MKSHIVDYNNRLKWVIDTCDWSAVERLTAKLLEVWNRNAQVWLCGNGGSAANANHAANDLIYGLAPNGKGMRAHALSGNTSVVTCLANDVGYRDIFSKQLSVLATEGDLLLVFSGSGNSENILDAIKSAQTIGVFTAGILGFSGGKAKALLDLPIHFPIEDMQISEDLQMMVIHMIVQHLKKTDYGANHCRWW